jgi:site-specific DNA-cytosine methylase
MIPDYEYDCRVLLEWTCNITRMDLLLEPGKTIRDEECEKFFHYINRRASHEPLQYLIGEWEFMGLPFKVNPSVLIPRQDTEVLIEWILEKEDTATAEKGEQITLLDVCTGSGCIAISLDHFLRQQCGYMVKTEALDISKDALETARKNNLLNETQVIFMESNMFENVDKKYDLKPTYKSTYKLNMRERKSGRVLKRLGFISSTYGRGNAGAIYDADGLCPTIIAGCGMGGNNVPHIYLGKKNKKDNIRRLTPIECLRLQGVRNSDIYKLVESGLFSDTDLYKLAGNSIAVPVLFKVFKELFK